MSRPARARLRARRSSASPRVERSCGVALTALGSCASRSRVLRGLDDRGAARGRFEGESPGSPPGAGTKIAAGVESEPRAAGRPRAVTHARPRADRGIAGRPDTDASAGVSSSQSGSSSAAQRSPERATPATQARPQLRSSSSSRRREETRCRRRGDDVGSHPGSAGLPPRRISGEVASSASTRVRGAGRAALAGGYRAVGREERRNGERCGRRGARGTRGRQPARSRARRRSADRQREAEVRPHADRHAELLRRETRERGADRDHVRHQSPRCERAAARQEVARPRRRSKDGHLVAAAAQRRAKPRDVCR